MLFNTNNDALRNKSLQFSQKKFSIYKSYKCMRFFNILKKIIIKKTENQSLGPVKILLGLVDIYIKANYYEQLIQINNN